MTDFWSFLRGPSLPPPVRSDSSPHAALVGSLCASLLVHALLWGGLVRPAQRQTPRETPGILVDLAELSVPRPVAPALRRVTPSPRRVHARSIPRRVRSVPGRRVSTPPRPDPLPQARADSPSPSKMPLRFAAPPQPREPHPRVTATPRNHQPVPVFPAPRSAPPAPPRSAAAVPAVPPSAREAPVTTTGPPPAATPSGAVQAVKPVAAMTGETGDATVPDDGRAAQARTAAPGQPPRPVQEAAAEPGIRSESRPVPAGPRSGPTHGARILRQSQPPYPPAARRDGVEGAVSLRVVLDADGAVQRIEVASSSGDARLDEAARHEVARWRFQPRMEDGAGVPTVLRVRVVFTLGDDP